MDRKKAGETAEEKAVSYLKSLGYTILERNFFSRFGEIDIIAKDRDTLVIIEVRSKSYKYFGMPEETVDKNKIKKIIKTTQIFLQKRNPDFSDLRFDIISILHNNISHIKNAFDMEFL
jgi:putative endonuclease